MQNKLTKKELTQFRIKFLELNIVTITGYAISLNFILNDFSLNIIGLFLLGLIFTFFLMSAFTMSVSLFSIFESNERKIPGDGIFWESIKKINNILVVIMGRDLDKRAVSSYIWGILLWYLWFAFIFGDKMSAFN